MVTGFASHFGGDTLGGVWPSRSSYPTSCRASLTPVVFSCLITQGAVASAPLRRELGRSAYMSASSQCSMNVEDLQRSSLGKVTSGSPSTDGFQCGDRVLVSENFPGFCRWRHTHPHACGQLCELDGKQRPNPRPHTFPYICLETKKACDPEMQAFDI